MKVGSKCVVYADLTFRISKNQSEIIIDSECESDNRLIYCLECDAVLVSSAKNSHTKFHEKIYDLEQRLEELEKLK